jgi:CRP-like cAMP-binding protein
MRLVRTADRLSCLMKSKLFAGLDDTALRQILGAAEVRQFAPQMTVIVQGGRPDHLFLLKNGRAQAHSLTASGSEILLLWAVPGVVLGLVSLLANPPSYKVTATTITECEFLVWDHAAIRTLVKAYPQLSENSFRLALHYLGRYMKRHANIVTENAESRLAQRLLQLATEAGEVQPSGIAIDITNEHLSSFSDISPFTASRLLSRWEHERKLTKQRGRVTLLAPEALQTLIAA